MFCIELFKLIFFLKFFTPANTIASIWLKQSVQKKFKRNPLDKAVYTKVVLKKIAMHLVIVPTSALHVHTLCSIETKPKRTWYEQELSNTSHSIIHFVSN